MEGSSGYGKLITLVLVSLFLLSSTIVMVQNNFDELSDDGSKIKSDLKVVEPDEADNKWVKDPIAEPDINRDRQRPDRDRTEIKRPTGESDNIERDTLDMALEKPNPEPPTPNPDLEYDIKERQPPQKRERERNEPEPAAKPKRLPDILPKISFPRLKGYMPQPGALAVKVNGSVPTQTWTAANSPYYITGDVVVPIGSTLLIEPGVDVVFNGSWSIYVEGALFANGTAVDRINFTSNLTSPAPGDWGSIQFNTTGSTPSLGRMSYCNFTFATKAVSIFSEGGIEVDHSHINYTSSWGMHITTGGFNVHHNIFNTSSYSIYIDIFNINKGSMSVGDLIIQNNWFTGTLGLMINRILFNNIDPSSDIVVGDTVITNNYINVSASKGISAQNFDFTNTQGGNLTWGDINISNNHIDMDAGSCIYFDGTIADLTNVNVTQGKLDVSNNNLTSPDTLGIDMDWWIIRDIDGNTVIDIGPTVIRNNIIDSNGDGIYFDWYQVAFTVSDNAIITIADLIIVNNTIVSGNNGIYLDCEQVAHTTRDNSIINTGDFILNENTIDAVSYGINFDMLSCIYNLYNNSMVGFGATYINDNIITITTGTGLNLRLNNNANYIYGNSVVTVDSVLQERNDVTATTGNPYGIFSYFDGVGDHLYNNAEVTFSDYHMNWNTINSTGRGLYASPVVTFGENIRGDSESRFGNIYITNNDVLSDTSYGIESEFDFGKQGYDNAISACGNVTVADNVVNCPNGDGFGLYVRNIGYELYGNNHVSLGWIRVLNNNFSSLSQEANYINFNSNGYDIYDNSTVDIGQWLFQNNTYISQNSYGIGFGSSSGDLGRYMYDNSSFNYQGMQIIDNRVWSKLRAFDLGPDMYGADMYDNTTATFGDCIIKNNYFNSSSEEGIYALWLQTFGHNLFQNASVTGGDLVIMSNDVDGLFSGRAVYAAPWYSGQDAHDNSYVLLGDIFINNNNITSRNAAGIEVSYYQIGYDMKPNLLTGCSAYFEIGDLFVNDNNIITTGNNNGGITVELAYVAYNMYDDASVTMGSFEIKRNTIISEDLGISVIRNIVGNNLYENNSVTIGNMEIIDNDLNCTDSNDALRFRMANCGRNMYWNSYLGMGNIDILYNTVNATSKGTEIQIQITGYQLYGNARVQLGNFRMNNNYIDSSDGGGLYFGGFHDLGKIMYGTSSFAMGNIEICNNTVKSPTADGFYISKFQYIGYNLDDFAEASIGDILICNNWVTAFDEGIFIHTFEYLGSKMDDNSTFTMGDLKLNDNNVWAEKRSGMYLEPGYFGYNMNDNTSAVFGKTEILNNYLNSTEMYGLYDRAWYYFGYDLFKNATFVIGDCWIMYNNISVHGVWSALEGSPYNSGSNVYDNAQAYFGDYLIKYNDIYSNQSTGIRSQFFSFGHTLKPLYLANCTSSVEMGDFQINYNNVTVNFNEEALYLQMNNNCQDLYGDASVTVGNIGLNNNTLSTPDDGIYVNSDYLGYNLVDTSMVTIGNIRMNDNVIDAGAYGIDFVRFERVGRQLRNDSSFTMGNFELIRNDINATGRGIHVDLQYFGYDLQQGSSATFGSFLFNDNTITSGGNGIYLNNIRWFGHTLSGTAYVEFVNFEFNRNNIHCTAGAGIAQANVGQFGSTMSSQADFVMSDWLINDNQIWSSSDGIQFEPTTFASNMDDSASSAIGSFHLKNNFVNSSNGNGILAYWWTFGYTLNMNAGVVVGDLVIMNNDVSVYGTDQAILVGMYDFGSYVQDHSTFTSGDLIVSENTVFAKSSMGIQNMNYYLGYKLRPGILNNADSSVVIGDIKFNDNNVNSPDSDGIMLDWQYICQNLFNTTNFEMGNVEVNRNTITAIKDDGIDFKIIQMGYSMYDRSSANISAIEIDGNQITAGGLGVLLSLHECASMLGNKAYLNIDDHSITGNSIVSVHAGFDYWLSDCGLTYNITIAHLPGLLVNGNSIKTGASAFNYTTKTSPKVGSHATSTQYWDDVMVSNNDFDGGSLGMSMIWTNVNDTITQPTYDIHNNNIHNGAADSTGLFLENIETAYLDNVTINNFGYGVYVSSSHIIRMLNSTISNTASSSIYHALDSSVYTLNTTFDKAKTYFIDSASALEVAWYLHVEVILQTGLIVRGANVTIADIDSTTIFSGKTGSNGQCEFIISKDYDEDTTGIIKSYNDHAIDANDAGMFGNTTTTMGITKKVTITLIDDFLPKLIKDNSDTLATTGDLFIFRANITDNLGVDGVFVEYWFGTGTHMNTSMGNEPYNHTAIIPWNSLDELHYYFTASDVVGNWLITGIVNLTVLDNDRPYSLLDDSESKAVYGNEFNFYTEALDNIGVTSVHAIWWYDTGSAENDTMIGTNPYSWQITIASSGVTKIHYYLAVTDAAGNWRIGPTHDINVTDSVSPIVEILTPSQDAVVGGTIEITVNATEENIGMDYVVVKVHDSEAYNGTPVSAIFTVEFDTTTLNDGFNFINAYAMDLAGNPGTAGVRINVDNTPPEVDAGPDRSVEEGNDVVFAGSASDAHIDESSYNWSFIYDGKDYYFSSKSIMFTFDIVGTYTVTLTASDTLGNTGSDTVVITVTEKEIPGPQRPSITDYVPEMDAIGVPLDTEVSIIFDMSMNRTTVEKWLTISPSVDLNLTWNVDYRALKITFVKGYETTYTITLNNAQAQTGGMLLDAPFVLSFTTLARSAAEKSITISPIADKEIEPGETITLSGTTTGYEAGTNVTVSIGGTSEAATVGADGSWSVSIKVPDAEGDFSLSVTIGDETETGTVTVEKPVDEKKKEAEDDNTMLYLIIVIVIVIVLLVVMLMMRKKKSEELEELEEE